MAFLSFLAKQAQQPRASSPLGRVDSPTPTTPTAAAVRLTFTSPATFVEGAEQPQYVPAAQTSQTSLITPTQCAHLIQIAQLLNIDVNTIAVASNQGHSYLKIAINLCSMYLRHKGFSQEEEALLFSNHFGHLNNGRVLITQSNIQAAVETLKAAAQTQTRGQNFDAQQLADLASLAQTFEINPRARDYLTLNRSSFFTAAKALCRQFLLNKGYSEEHANDLVNQNFNIFAIDLHGHLIHDQKTIPNDCVRAAATNLINAYNQIQASAVG